METLTIEDLKTLISAIDAKIFFDPFEIKSLNKSRAIIEQIIKDREFERDQTTLPKL